MPDTFQSVKMVSEFGMVIVTSFWLYFMLKHRKELPYSIGKLGKILIFGVILVWTGFIANFLNEFIPRMTTSAGIIRISKVIDDIFIIIGASIITYYLYKVFEKEIIKVEPAHITISKEKETLKPGAYLALSQSPRDIVKVLKDKRVLAITRHPEVYNNLGIPYIWITKMEGDNTIYPTNLPKLLHTMVTKADKDTAFILDGLEYLILENGFDSVMKFLSSAKDYMSMKNSTLIVTIGRGTLDEHQLAILKRELEELEII
ncbi:putative regulatory protein [Pyrococcus sp. ST04]|nr:putative regulatory protein [Pyrococcus sp. ST04]